MPVGSSVRTIWKAFKNLARLGELIEVLDRARELHARNEQLENENRDLCEKLKFKGKLRLADNVLHGDAEDPGPFCSGCWDSKKEAIHLTRCANPTVYDCPVCHRTYQTKPSEPARWQPPGP